MLDVLTGNVPAGRLVFLSVERLLNDLERAHARDAAFPYFFDQGAAVAIIKYFRDFCPFKLDPFQQFILRGNLLPAGQKVVLCYVGVHGSSPRAPKIPDRLYRNGQG